MGFGLSREAVMEIAFTIVDNSKGNTPIKMERLAAPGLKPGKCHQN